MILKIENRVEIENEVDRPSHLIEYRSRQKTREVDSASDGTLRLRLSEAERDFSTFHLDYYYADELLKKYPARMQKAAESGLEHDSVRAVIDAARTLQRFGDGRGMKKLKQRLLEYREKDGSEFGGVLNHFKEVQPEFNADEIKQLGAIANSESRIAGDAAFLLRKLDIDAQPLQRHLRNGKLDAKSLIWLLKHTPSDLVLEAAGLELAKPQDSYGFRNTELHGLVFKLASGDSRFDSLARLAEEKTKEYLLKDSTDEWSEAECWELLDQYATARSIPFLESRMADCDSTKLFPRILGMLQRLGAQESAERNFRSRLQKTFESVSKPRYMSWNEDLMRDELLRLAPMILGPEETVEKCIDASSKSLAEFVENTRDVSAAKSLNCDPDALQVAREKAIKRLKQESGNIGGAHFSGFARNWYQNGLSRQSAVDWINDKLAPAKKLTVQMVLDNQKYPEDHDLWLTWSRFDCRVSDIHTFVVVALAHSGYGNLAHWEYTHPEAVTSSIEEYADVESNEFQIGSYDQDGRYPQSYSINVNRRSYHFDVHEGGNGSDERYDVGAIVEIMNTIAVRQRLKRRFFIYETLSEVGYCLVMFLTPDQADELHAKFGISPSRGTDHYLEN